MSLFSFSLFSKSVNGPMILLTSSVNEVNMNPKFYNLSLEKQTKIINAAYKVFALNDYKKAPMSQIAQEGNISKSLLFHYFHNKFELYTFLWKQALQLSKETMKDYRVYETKDFFEMLERSLKGKCTLIKAYPYLSLFCMKAYYEKEEEVQKFIHSSFDEAKLDAFQKASDAVDFAGIKEGFSFEEVYQEILYASDGYLWERYRAENLDALQIEQEYMHRIQLWKKAFGE